MGKSELSKKNIVDVTIQLMRKNGVATVKDISSFGGVNIAAINYHFRDKQSLMNLVIEQVFDEAIANSRLISETKVCADRDEAARTITELVLVFMEENVGVIKYVMSEKLSLENGNISTFYRKFRDLYSLSEKHMQFINPDMDEERLLTKFQIAFSAYFMPLLFELCVENDIETIRDTMKMNREMFIDEISRIFLF